MASLHGHDGRQGSFSGFLQFCDVVLGYILRIIARIFSQESSVYLCWKFPWHGFGAVMVTFVWPRCLFCCGWSCSAYLEMEQAVFMGMTSLYRHNISGSFFCSAIVFNLFLCISSTFLEHTRNVFVFPYSILAVLLLSATISWVWAWCGDLRF